MKIKPINGLRFGRLIVTSDYAGKKNRTIYCECLCDCGNSKLVSKSSLVSGLTKSCGCLAKEIHAELAKAKVKNLIGIRVGRLVVQSRNIEQQLKLNSKSAYWNCVCDCGKEAVVCGGSLLRKNATQSCGCYAIECCKNRKTNIGEFGEASFNEAYGIYKSNAAAREYAFNLTIEQFREITGKNCFYCGLPPSNVVKSNCGNGDYIYNGIDRVDNTVGYIESNCVSCCFICNRSKCGMTAEEFLVWVSKVYMKNQVRLGR
jgi:hypothetical protein